MTTSPFARFACAFIALALTALTVTEATTVNPINFHGEGSERPALYA